VTNADGFSIERKYSWEDDSAFILRGTVGATESGFNDGVGDHIMMLFYRVRAYNAAGNSPYTYSDSVFVP
jgi:hypothetical protein